MCIRDRLYERHRRLILDPDLRALADLMVATVPGEVGMYLGCLLYTSRCV